MSLKLAGGHDTCYIAHQFQCQRSQAHIVCTTRLCLFNSAAIFLVSYGGRSRNCCWGDLIPFLYPLLPFVTLCSSSRSSDVFTCVVPRTHTGFGDRAFQVAGPRLWNSLPASLHQSDTTVGQFKKLLKTHLFSWDCGALVTVAFTAPCINISITTTTTTTATTTTTTTTTVNIYTVS